MLLELGLCDPKLRFQVVDDLPPVAGATASPIGDLHALNSTTALGELESRYCLSDVLLRAVDVANDEHLGGRPGEALLKQEGQLRIPVRVPVQVLLVPGQALDAV